jgi:hypothetical protein
LASRIDSRLGEAPPPLARSSTVLRRRRGLLPPHPAWRSTALIQRLMANYESRGAFKWHLLHVTAHPSILEDALVRATLGELAAGAPCAGEAAPGGDERPSCHDAEPPHALSGPVSRSPPPAGIASSAHGAIWRCACGEHHPAERWVCGVGLCRQTHCDSCGGAGHARPFCPEGSKHYSASRVAPPAVVLPPFADSVLAALTWTDDVLALFIRGSSEYRLPQQRLRTAVEILRMLGEDGRVR